MWGICCVSANRAVVGAKWVLFLENIYGRPGAADSAIKVLNRQYPVCKIHETHSWNKGSGTESEGLSVPPITWTDPSIIRVNFGEKACQKVRDYNFVRCFSSVTLQPCGSAVWNLATSSRYAPILKHFQSVLVLCCQSASFMLCSKLPLKTTNEDAKEEAMTSEMTSGVATASEIRTETSVLSELDAILTLKGR